MRGEIIKLRYLPTPRWTAAVVAATVVIVGAVLLIVTPEDPALVTHRLADAGIYLRALSVHRATLEDAFLALTHKETQS